MICSTPPDPEVCTVTVVVAVAEPEAFVAVNVYVVVAVGLTFIDPLADVDVNALGVMAILVAPLVAQLNVLLFPEAMPAGLAAKDVTVGVDPGLGLDLPAPLVTPLAHPFRPMLASTRQSAQTPHACRPQESAALPGELGAFTPGPPSCFSHKCKERLDHVTTGQKGRYRDDNGLVRRLGDLLRPLGRTTGQNP